MKRVTLLLLFLICFVIKAEEIVQKITLEPANSAHLVKKDGFWHIPVEYGRDSDGRIVMEAENPAVFVSGKKKDGQSNYGNDKKAGGGKYIMRMQRGAYVFQVPRRRTYRVWYRANFPAAGNWFHSESMDKSGNIHTNYDYDSASPKAAKTWVWVKGTVYDLAAGSHILELDWQGGALLDQIVLVPEEQPAPQGAALTAYTLRRKGVKNIPLKPLRLQDNENLQAVDWQGKTGSGKAELFYSVDGGENFIPADGKKLPAGRTIQLQIKVTPDNGSYPQLPPVTATTIRRINDNSLDPAVKTLVKKISAVDLIGESWNGMRFKNGFWHLANTITPDRNNVLWMDAVDTDNLVIAPKNRSWFREDAGAYHGKALYQGLLNRNILSYDCTIRESGEYRPWFRVKLLYNAKKYKSGIYAFGVTYNVNLPYVPLMYQVDNESPVEFSGDGKPFPKDDFLKSQWVWIPARRINLSAGNHTFRIRAGLDFMLLDRVALVPEKSNFTPTGKGAPSVRKSAAAGEIIFQNLDFNRKIASLTAKNNSGLKLSWEGSEDGRSWRPVLPGSAVPQFLKVRCQSLNSGTASPKVSGFTLETDKPLQYAVFNCGNQQFWLDPHQGALAGWKNSSGSWMIPLGSRQQQLFKLYSVTFKNDLPGKKQLFFNFLGCRYEKDTFFMEYKEQNSDLKVAISISPESDGLAKWQMTMVNNSALDLRDPEFPKVRNIRPAIDPEEVMAVATQPNFGGVDFTGAPLELASPGKAFTGFNASFAGTYPGWFTMGWSAFYTRKQGSFTIQSRNPDATAITFDSKAENNAIKTSLLRKITIAPKETAKVSYALGWQPGDWHTPADSYSKWAHSWMDFSRVNSNWIRKSDGWVSCSFYYDSAYIPTRFPTHMAPEMRWMGTQHFMMFYSCIDNTPGPANYPFLNTKLGTVAEFKKGFIDARKQGIHCSTYCDARGWCDDYSDGYFMGRTQRTLLPKDAIVPPRGFGFENATMLENGSRMPFGYVPNDYSLCAASKPWQEHLVRSLAYNMAELTHSNIYHDEANFYGDCYNIKHTHGKQHGQHMAGLVETHRRALTEGRKHYPGMVLAIEGSPDVLAQNADVLLFGLSGYANGTAFQYVFPEAKLYRGISNPGAEWFMNLEEYTRYVHLFNRLDSHPDSKNSRNFFFHRKRINHWMYMRRFMDDVDLDITMPGINAKWFKTDGADGVAALVNIHNEYAIKGAEGIIHWDKLKNVSAVTGYLFDEENAQRLNFRPTADGIRFEIPSAKASSILIVARCPREEQLQVSLVWPQKHGKDILRLMVNNLSSAPIAAKLSWKLPEPVKISNIPLPAAFAPGLTVLEFPMDGRCQLKELTDVSVTVSGGDAVKNASAVVTPIIMNGDFEYDSAGKGTPDHWRAIGWYWKYLLQRQPASWFDINHADGYLDPVNPASGKYSLCLPGRILMPFFANNILFGTRELKEVSVPLQPWYFHTSQRFIGKPNTKYKISYKYRFADDSGVLEVRTLAPGKVYGTSYLKKHTAIPGDRSWQSGSFIHALGTSMTNHPLVFANMSGAPMWIDDIQVTEL